MTFPVAFAAGLAAFFSPCILPLLPVWLAFMGGGGTKSKGALAKNLLLFTAGFSVVFTAMGAGATLIGQFLREYRLILMKVAGVALILFGLQLLGLLRLRFLAKERRFKLSKKRTALGYFLLGVILALGWTPCTGMILGSIIMLASSLSTVGEGMLLLFVYSLGFALPFFILGLALGSIPKIKSGRWSRYVQTGAGLVLIIMGALLLFDRWGWLQNL